MERLTQTDRAIIVAINYHLTRGERIGIAQVAEECCVAKSTVVKATKKLGYLGFSDAVRKLHEQPASELDENLLATDIVDGDLLEESERIARMLWKHRNSKNIIGSSEHGTGHVLASYLARKLAMFDIFAPMTYDYATAVGADKQTGLAFFFTHSGPRDSAGRSASVTMDEVLSNLVTKSGFHVVLVTDMPDTPARDKAEVIIPIHPSANDGIDLYVARTIMFFEFVLSDYANIASIHDARHRETRP